VEFICATAFTPISLKQVVLWWDLAVEGLMPLSKVHISLNDRMISQSINQFISNSSRSRHWLRNKFHKPLDIECITYQKKRSKLIIGMSQGKHNIKYIQ
jgi:hypothetical protein